VRALVPLGEGPAAGGIDAGVRSLIVVSGKAIKWPPACPQHMLNLAGRLKTAGSLLACETKPAALLRAGLSRRESSAAQAEGLGPLTATRRSRLPPAVQPLSQRPGVDAEGGRPFLPYEVTPLFE